MAWKDLSIRDKAAYIASSVASGNFNLNRIKEDFNSNLEHFKNADANFVQRLNNNDTRSIIGSDGRPQTHRLGWEYEGDHAIIYPEVQDNNGVIEPGDLQSAIERRDTIHTSTPFARYYTKNYKKDYPEFFNKFEDGGNRRTLFNKEKVLNRVYGDGQAFAEGNGGITSSVMEYLFNKDSAVEDRIRDAEVGAEKYKDILKSGNPDLIYKTFRDLPEDEQRLFDLGRMIDVIKQHEDAKRVYLGYSPKYGYIEKSKYKPTIGNSENPYQVNPLMTAGEFDNLILPLWSQWKGGSGSNVPVSEGYLGLKTSQKPRAESKGNVALVRNLPYISDATMSIGYDDNGQYLSLYDIWDYNTNVINTPGDNVGKYIGGKPFEIYQRYYLDDWLDIPEDSRGNPYIAPVYITANKKNGGSIHIKPEFAFGGNVFSGKDKNKPTQKMHMWGEFDYPETIRPSANKYERISNDRYNSAFNTLTNAGYKGGDADRLAQILASQSITETGWVDKNDTHNYAGYLNSKGKLIKYDSPEHFWSDHISNLSSKWPEWNTANNTDEYFDIVNHTDLGLNTLDKFNKYNKAHRDNPVYIYAPDWQNQNYSGRMKSVSKRASKYFPKKLGPIY